MYRTVNIIIHIVILLTQSSIKAYKVLVKRRNISPYILPNMMLAEILLWLTTLLVHATSSNEDVGLSLTEVKNVECWAQLFYCFKMMANVLDRLTTSASNFGLTYQQLF